jgi:hypothetical protein
MMASHSQLKYGARLINSYLGNNATISCCEVLNSLIFPAHEQHHNNSFLCASTVMGQSNIAAGATIGSNHNSRSADGEIIAGRGFWPGLCVSLKHNSKFAIYTMMAKGDYPAELNITLPFCLVNNDVTNDRLQVMPAYWFMYNMYALARNSWKYLARDQRTDRKQHIEYDYLAPDSINEMFNGLKFLIRFTGQAYLKSKNAGAEYSEKEIMQAGKKLLENDDVIVDKLEIIANCFENSKRKVVLLKTRKAYQLYKELIRYYSVCELISAVKSNSYTSVNDLASAFTNKATRSEWMNIGGQLVPKNEVDNLIKNVKKGKVKSWDDLHIFYSAQQDNYQEQKLNHALGCLKELDAITINKVSNERLLQLLDAAVKTKEWMTKGIYDSRAKDYTNPFRQMVYDSKEEMEAVTGKLEDNSFIKHQQDQLKEFKKQVKSVTKQLKLS